MMNLVFGVTCAVLVAISPIQSSKSEELVVRSRIENGLKAIQQGRNEQFLLEFVSPETLKKMLQQTASSNVGELALVMKKGQPSQFDKTASMLKAALESPIEILPDRSLAIVRFPTAVDGRTQCALVRRDGVWFLL